MTDPICAKVAAIIDDTTLVLNVGSTQGVREGMVFSIVSEHQEIMDPDTGTGLGSWEIPKARVVVTHVQERMCTVRSPLRQEAGVPGTLSAMMVRHSFGLFGDRQDDRPGLGVRRVGLSGLPKVEPVQVGDRARVVELQEQVEPTRAPNEGAEASGLPSQTYTVSSTPVPPGPDESGTENEQAGGQGDAA